MQGRVLLGMNHTRYLVAVTIRALLNLGRTENVFLELSYIYS